MVIVLLKVANLSFVTEGAAALLVLMPVVCLLAQRVSVYISVSLCNS